MTICCNKHTILAAVGHHFTNCLGVQIIYGKPSGSGAVKEDAQSLAAQNSLLPNVKIISVLVISSPHAIQMTNPLCFIVREKD